MNLNDRLILKMIELEKGLPKRIHHFLKVYEFAHLIALSEQLDAEQQQLLEIAAIVHDIGITPSKQKYGYCDSITQGIEGPKRVMELFKAFPELSEATIQRVCYLIIHHHDYDKIEGLDYQILVEADFLTNAFEEKLSADKIRTIREKIFKTKAGIQLLESIYNL